MERILFWCLCLAPAVALVLVFPWKKLLNGTLFKKKDKAPKEKKETKVKEEKVKKIKADKHKKVAVQQVSEPEPAVEAESAEEENGEEEEHNTIANREFAEFLQARRRRVVPPPRNFEEERDYTRFVSPFSRDGDEDSGFRKPAKQEKTIAEELDTISPELKALIISGALDRKNFDDMGENK